MVFCRIPFSVDFYFVFHHLAVESKIGGASWEFGVGGKGAGAAGCGGCGGVYETQTPSLSSPLCTE